MRLDKFAAIDIGSNAIRMLVANVVIDKDQPTQFHKNSIVRVPIRLGEDSFTVGEISSKNVKRLTRAFKAFKQIMKVHEVSRYRAYATSALREASNTPWVLDKIKEKTGISVEVIDGRKEAKIISTNTGLQNINIRNKTFLFVDVGGGSTEFSIIRNGELLASKSFKLGTVRLLNDLVPDRVWKEIKKWVVGHTKEYKKIAVLGTGGNINKLVKLTSTKEGKPLSLVALSSIYHQLQSLTYEERILQFELNPDRADVILPATRIYLRAMGWCGATRIYIPKAGLADGMIQEMFESMYA
ncbi:MAG: Guanosine-5'-triphosphate,3'-diphosphate pyrophosphatase [Flavobacteriaceae bacterium]|nr:MAG: Guanosine-5'-triphosphate,3'-diphosphate pyrophosphatase [Flavobacteriaceae bacterium]